MIKLIQKAIKNAIEQKSKLTNNILNLDGMSSSTIRHFLNNIINEQSRYLEIGCWKGSTFCSAMYDNNPIESFVIDNWSEFLYGDIKKNFFENTKQFIKTKYQVIEADCFNINPKEYNIFDINTYFYDGKHTYETQKLAITYYYNYLSNNFIFIVDDWEYEGVKNGTIDGIKELNLKILYDFEGLSSEGWWNGFYISLLSKE